MLHSSSHSEPAYAAWLLPGTDSVNGRNLCIFGPCCCPHHFLSLPGTCMQPSCNPGGGSESCSITSWRGSIRPPLSSPSLSFLICKVGLTVFLAGLVGKPAEQTQREPGTQNTHHMCHSTSLGSLSTSDTGWSFNIVTAISTRIRRRRQEDAN